jgi:hypothetical protein
MTPLRFTNPSPPSGWVKDFHLQAVEHARHTNKKPGASRRFCFSSSAVIAREVGRSSIPEAAVIEPRSRGVLDALAFAGQTSSLGERFRS